MLPVAGTGRLARKLVFCLSALVLREWLDPVDIMESPVLQMINQWNNLKACPLSSQSINPILKAG
ncbi:MAG: hypothetical protein COB78_07080 [Hyphomicrobiales bacterium]|nr:MAG: hypothetical protein COB78_07080 [Hyphomicrobiales bacterium]